MQLIVRIPANRSEAETSYSVFISSPNEKQKVYTTKSN